MTGVILIILIIITTNVLFYQWVFNAKEVRGKQTIEDIQKEVMEEGK